jgi:hypothetical protein
MITILTALEAYTDNQRACLEYLHRVGIASIDLSVTPAEPGSTALPHTSRDYDYFADLDKRIGALTRMPTATKFLSPKDVAGS